MLARMYIGRQAGRLYCSSGGGSWLARVLMLGWKLVVVVVVVVVVVTRQPAFDGQCGGEYGERVSWSRTEEGKANLQRAGGGVETAEGCEGQANRESEQARLRHGQTGSLMAPPATASPVGKGCETHRGKDRDQAARG